jgi:hypothetical protein
VTEPFERRVLEAVRPQAERRARGRFYWLWRAWARPRDVVKMYEGARIERRGRASIMSAVTEAAERFSEQERFEFDHDGTLPGWFWEWVEDRAKWWDRQV